MIRKGLLLSLALFCSGLHAAGGTPPAGPTPPAPTSTSRYFTSFSTSRPRKLLSLAGALAFAIWIANERKASKSLADLYEPTKRIENLVRVLKTLRRQSKEEDDVFEQREDIKKIRETMVFLNAQASQKRLSIKKASRNASLSGWATVLSVIFALAPTFLS